MNQRDAVKVKKYSKFAKTTSNVRFVAVDSCGAVGDGMTKLFKDADEFLTRKRRQRFRDTFDTRNNVPNGEMRRAKERISIAVCKANAVYMKAVRRGRLANGLNKAQCLAKATKRKEEKAIKAEKLAQRSLGESVPDIAL